MVGVQGQSAVGAGKSFCVDRSRRGRGPGTRGEVATREILFGCGSKWFNQFDLPSCHHHLITPFAWANHSPPLFPPTPALQHTHSFCTSFKHIYPYIMDFAQSNSEVTRLQANASAKKRVRRPSIPFSKTYRNANEGSVLHTAGVLSISPFINPTIPYTCQWLLPI